MQEIKLGKITRILVRLNTISIKYRLQIILIVFCIKNTVISKGGKDEYMLNTTIQGSTKFTQVVG
jgi:hypothetical protein